MGGHLVTSSAPLHQVFRRRWDLLPRRGELRSTVSDKGPRHYELRAEPICLPASGQRIVDSTLRPKRGERLCAGCRVICLRRDRARRT